LLYFIGVHVHDNDVRTGSYRSSQWSCVCVVHAVQVNRMGVPQENTSGQCTQLMTCSTDQ